MRVPGVSFFIGGDFNARAILWGAPSTDVRGEIIMEWASALDLGLLNEPGVCTCVRPQGSSVVDLSWVSAGLVSSIVEWSVFETMESLSDHLYIGISLRKSDPNNRAIAHIKRWNFSK